MEINEKRLELIRDSLRVAEALITTGDACFFPEPYCGKLKESIDEVKALRRDFDSRIQIIKESKEV